MPEMFFRIRWPDATETDNYSPSLIIKDYFTQGDELALPEFLEKIRTALAIASDRVKAKYGYPCSRAHATLAAIERHAAPLLAHPDARIKILEFS
jgi:uncharacterized repeat protein (TIGR04042 family)